MERLAKKVILFGWDAADWDIARPLMDSGQMPYLKALCDAGSYGPICSMVPMLSPILWTSIATGKQADKHQVLGFTEPDPVAQDGSIRPVRSDSRKVKALWNILDEAGIRTCVLNWFASYPAEHLQNGIIVSNFFAKPYKIEKKGEPDRVGARGCCWPTRLEKSLSDTVITPPKMRFSDIVQYIPQIADMSEEDVKNDPLMLQFNRMYCSMASLQMATTKLVQQEDWEFLAIYHGAIDTFGHAFMDFRAPKLDRVDQDKFDRYKGVMDTIYREHDQMLGDLIELAGEDTAIIIVSDHGFHHAESRPTTSSQIDMGDPVAWHRPYGMVAMGGEGIANTDSPIDDAGLLDLTPTILRLFGLPIATDMPGKVLISALDIDDDGTIDSVWTYEGDEPFQADLGDDLTDDPWATEEMVRSLMELGYVEEGEDKAKTAVFSRHFCLGQVYASQDRVIDALAEFDAAAKIDPEKAKAIDQIRLRTAVQGGYPELVEKLAHELEDRMSEPLRKAFQGMVLVRRGQIDEGVAILKSIVESLANISGVNQSIGMILHRVGIDELALQYLEISLTTEGDLPKTRFALGVTYWKQGKHEQAVTEIMRTIQLRRFNPKAHYFLATMLTAMDERDLACKAIDAAIKQWPTYPMAHALKAQICLASDDRDGFEKHKTIALEHNDRLVSHDFECSPFGAMGTASTGLEEIADLLEPQNVQST